MPQLPQTVTESAKHREIRNEAFYGGTFTTVNGTPRNYIASVNSSNGSLINNWNPDCNNQVYTVAVVDVYIFRRSFYEGWAYFRNTFQG